jgi:hypothetical protein
LSKCEARKVAAFAVAPANRFYTTTTSAPLLIAGALLNNAMEKMELNQCDTTAPVARLGVDVVEIVAKVSTGFN